MRAAARLVQQPHPPVFVAAIGTPQSFEWAGRQGYGVMIVPYLSHFADVRRLFAEHVMPRFRSSGTGSAA
jgi:alkanesulfonate monooxygenase SsuD/methylene tetrahydromethanopterin reductase-like flavin-dependent oxidoreductase (luciferase family)